MASRVLTGSKLSRVEPVHWMMAFGEPFHASPPRDDDQNPAADSQTTSQKMDAALQRVQILERRIQELEGELPRRQEAGRREGRAEGEKAGAEAASLALKPLLDRFAATIADLASYRARFRRESEPELLALALAVAKKILRRELTVDPHSLLGILKAALECINQAEVLCVRTAPEDAAQLTGRLSDLGLPDQVEVISDRSLARGSVILDTRRGQIDASVQTQLAEIENGFADRIATHNTK